MSWALPGRQACTKPSMWGPSPKMPAVETNQMHLNIDGSAATSLYQFDGDVGIVDFLQYDVTNLAYRIWNKGQQAVVGSGAVATYVRASTATWCAPNDADLVRLTRLYHVDLTAATDARPFFFNQLVLTDPASLVPRHSGYDFLSEGSG